MLRGALTGYVDVAQVTLYVFWGFFACLIYYLARENHREGYPLVSEKSDVGEQMPEGFPIPAVKTYRLYHGGDAQSPPNYPARAPEGARPAAGFPGAPLVPTGNPLVDGVGPASYCNREDTPDLTFEGDDKFKPLRVALEYRVDPGEPPPQGMRVIANDGIEVGGVIDVWINLIEHATVYLEVELAGVATSPRVLIPERYVRYRRRARQVVVRSLSAEQFLDIPRTRHPDRITRLEDDKLVGYFGGGTLYGKAGRSEPLL